MKKILVLAVLALLLGSIGTGALAAEKKLRFAIVPKNLNNPFWAEVGRGMKDEAKRLGVDAQMVAPVEADSNKQVDMINGLISKGIDGIAISPNDPRGVEKVIARAIKAKIPTICFDSDAPGSKRICYIGTDNTVGGRHAGEEMVRFMGKKGKVLIVTGGFSAFNLNQRIKGFTDVLKAKAPGIRIMPIQACDDDQNKAMDIIRATLQANRDLTGIYGVGAWAGVPAGELVKQKKLVGKVTIVCFDTLKPEMKLVKEGAVQALIGQKPYDMGVKSVRMLYDLNHGKKPAKIINDTGVVVVTKANVNRMLAAAK